MGVPLPPSSAFSSSLRYLDNSVWCTFPECFADVKTLQQMSDTWGQWALRPPVASGLTVLTPVPPPCSLTICQSGNCERSDQVPCDAPSLMWLLKWFAKTLQGAQGFLGHEPPHLLAWPWNKYFFTPNSDFQFVWPHCVLGTRTCMNISTLPFSLHFWVMKGKPYIFRVMCLLPDP